MNIFKRWSILKWLLLFLSTTFVLYFFILLPSWQGRLIPGLQIIYGAALAMIGVCYLLMLAKLLLLVIAFPKIGLPIFFLSLIALTACINPEYALSVVLPAGYILDHFIFARNPKYLLTPLLAVIDSISYIDTASDAIEIRKAEKIRLEAQRGFNTGFKADGDTSSTNSLNSMDCETDGFY